MFREEQNSKKRKERSDRKDPVRSKKPDPPVSEAMQYGGHGSMFLVEPSLSKSARVDTRFLFLCLLRVWHGWGLVSNNSLGEFGAAVGDGVHARCVNLESRVCKALCASSVQRLIVLLSLAIRHRQHRCEQESLIALSVSLVRAHHSIFCPDAWPWRAGAHQLFQQLPPVCAQGTPCFPEKPASRGKHGIRCRMKAYIKCWFHVRIQ